MKITLYLSFFLLLLTSACEEELSELNVNRIQPTSIDPVYILNDALVNTTAVGGTLIYDIGIVQQLISPNSGVITGANYNQDNRNVTAGLWERYYRNVIRNTSDVIVQTTGDPERNNLQQMARIWQAYAFMTLTDTYGDIPYFEAGRGVTDQIVRPSYDAQEDIYADLIDELQEASAALAAGAATEVGDVLYGGDVDKWRRLGYSLLLRAGMRLSKVDPARAEQLAGIALQGGVMQSNADNAVIRHDANYTNTIGNILNGSEANNFFLAAPFVDHLQSTNDPRLGAIAVRYVGAASGPEQTADRATSDPELQVGMPLGYDNNTIRAVATELGLASFYAFSQADRTRVAKLQAPTFLVTYAQTQLLLAEAAARGWVDGSAADYFTNGVRAHMEQMADFDPGSAIAEDDIAAYLAANSYEEDNALEQINTEYWIASFLNGAEAFANFRRSGYPELTPNPFPGQDISGDFIRRLTYPNAEISVNSDNVNAAISRQGPDNLETRVWWDVG